MGLHIIRSMNSLLWIERGMGRRLREGLRGFPVVALTGARQVGKTSLCRHVWPDAAYVTLDIPSVADSARLAPERFLDEHPPPLILDEIQYAPELLRHLKVRVDRDPRPGSYLVTGSQDFLLMQGVTESLAGRCAVLALPPLALSEVLEAGAIPADEADTYFWRGGWPALWRDRTLDRDLWHGSYVATYLERDVRNILNVGSLRDFDRFLRACALRAGQLLSLAELARDVGVAPNTAKAWLSVLQASHQVFLIEPWHVNAGKRLIKSPKLHLGDSGLLLYLMGFRRWTDVLASAGFGAIWENIVVAEVRKALWNQGRRDPLYFWRTAAGEEVDLVIETGARRFIAVECKAAERVEAGDARGIRAMGRAYGDAAMEAAICVCRTPRAYPLSPDGRLHAMPLRAAVERIAGRE